MKTYLKSKDIPIEEVAKGLRRQILGYNTNLMLVKVYFDKDGIAEHHKHPHQQVTYVEKGTFEVDIDGNKETVEKGDSFIVPADATHGAVCLEEGILIDAFSPAREDFLGTVPK